LASPDEIRANGYSLHPPEYQDRTLAPTAADTAREELDTLFEDLTAPSYIAGKDAGWPLHRLGDVCDIQTGVPYSSLKRALSRADTARGAVPVVYPRHLRDGVVRADDAPDADVAALDEYRLQTRDVLWIRTGAMGQTAIVRPGESGWLPHTNLLRLRVTETAKLDPAYLLAYLSQPAVRARIRDRSVRSVTTSLSTATLSDLEVPVPLLVEQQRILSALRSLDEQTATLERHLNASRAARTALARYLTDGTVILTEGETSE
jgi:type I restriction enzyme M protein